jgi:four helix bundle protein
VSSLVRSFPQDERFRLSDQLLRASRSVTANIAEGYGRYHYQENIQFCRQARGSLYEIVDHITVAMDEGYIDKKRVAELKEKSFNVARMLNGYIQYLSTRKLLSKNS